MVGGIKSGEFGSGIVIVKVFAVRWESTQELECVAVPVEGVGNRVLVTENNLHNIVSLKNGGLSILAVHCRIGCEVTGGQNGVEYGDLWLSVAGVV